jgi:CPA2 family monovalent cation:H+ antiporter-2
MHDFDYFRDGVVILVAAVALVWIFHRLKASPVLGYLAAGLLIGPSVLGLVKNVSVIQHLAEFGVVFLLFLVGLELSFRRLASMRTEVFGLGTAQVLVTALLAAIALIAVGLGMRPALVVGFAVAMSSTAIVLQVLGESQSAGRLGRTAFSILLLQDLAIIPLLAVVPLLGGGAGGATDLGAVGLAVAKAAGAVGAILLIGRFLLTPVFRAVAGIGRHELFVAISLLIVLGTAAATEAVGLSLTLGAFLAGLMLAETEFRHQIEVDIKPFEGLLLGLFFVSIGMSIDAGFALAHWWQVLALLAALIVLKAGVIYALCRLIAMPAPLAIRAGLLLAQASEFAFVLIGIAARESVVSEDVRQMTLAVASLSMALTPFLALLGQRLALRLERATRIGLAALEQENIDLQQHVVIGGHGRFGQMVSRILADHKIDYVALDLNAAHVAAEKARGTPIHFADARRPEILWGVGIDRARAIVLTVGDDPAGTTRIVRHLRQHLPDLLVLVRARDGDGAKALREAGATEAVPDALASSLHLAQTVTRHFGLPAQDLSRLIEEYGDERRGDRRNAG